MLLRRTSTANINIEYYSEHGRESCKLECSRPYKYVHCAFTLRFVRLLCIFYVFTARLLCSCAVTAACSSPAFCILTVCLLRVYSAKDVRASWKEDNVL